MCHLHLTPKWKGLKKDTPEQKWSKQVQLQNFHKILSKSYRGYLKNH